jgi:hypothetical protein
MAPSPITIASDLSGLSPMAVRDIHLAKRAPYKVDPSAGSRPADAFNNVGVQVVFALIGVGMVCTALWFFFWAKNGGFKWNGKDDWEDYKSTVLRRKGPDGRTLSNATKSTKLGGGSVVHGSHAAPTSIGYTDETGTSADFSEMREVEEGKGRHNFGLRGGDGAKPKRSRRDRENNRHDADLDGYRKERAARVGGINREADGMYTDYSATEPSELGSNVSSQPLVKDKAKEKAPKDKKKELKDKERRARERMRVAKLAEKEAAKLAAAETKAQKAAEKEAAKKEKEGQKKTKRAQREGTPSEYTPAMTEYTAPSEYNAATEYTAPSEYNAPTEYTASEYPAPAPAARASRRAPPSAAYSFMTGDDQTVYTGVSTESPPRARAAPPAPPSTIPESSYYSDYRPNGRSSSKPRESRTRRESQSQPRPKGSRSRPTSQSPTKRERPSRPATAAAPADMFTAANGPAQGNMSYPCHIPGLSTAGSVAVSDSVSQVGRRQERRQRDVMAGYRRGAGGVRTVRRDSLSDSDH